MTRSSQPFTGKYRPAFRQIARIGRFIYTRAMKKYPFSFLALALLGGLASIPGLTSLLGYGYLIHPVLDDPMAGLAFMVSALALFGSAAFPLVLQRLREAESQ